MRKWKIILTIILTLLIVPVATGAIYVNFILDKVIVDDEFDKDFDLMTNDNLSESNIKNIALFGVDCRTTDYKGCRSDVMMVLSYDMDENNVTVTSLVRDTYVEIGDRGFDKLNHAYAFGGAELAIQTINRNFDLNIKDYITVDFWTVEAIIDAVGGVEIDISEAELPYVNQYITGLNNESGTASGRLLSSAGVQKLDGRQAVAYMRVRYVGDGDFERMQRQREVMGVALDGLKSMSLPKMLSLVNDLLTSVRTNLTKSEIIELVTKVATQGVPTMEQFQLPTRDGGIGSTINGIYYFLPNTLLENVTLFHESIYSETEYIPSESVLEINNKLLPYFN